ncbi:hypothetical protein POX_g09298 [Penicillium oxalicum]|uniref:hypothetical protein n=1 Tax=Penicillium oxalicum TaxID=69781 RepID=UPI0020B74558|nr:hypothetical protein POX_g09298 [Penicillium oxalicum]KAI2786902.1 hypothetical protein POX_g09298 [Penicillium oxalicum]
MSLVRAQELSPAIKWPLQPAGGSILYTIVKIFKSRSANRPQDEPWGYRWRSSDQFITATMYLALFTGNVSISNVYSIALQAIANSGRQLQDVLLFAFTLPLLPIMFEDRIGLDSSHTQRFTSIFLIEGALVSIVSSPFAGSLADAVTSKKLLLLALLILTLISTACLALTKNLPLLFVGRFFQSLTGNGLWIVAMATLAANLGAENMGRIAGLAEVLTSAGTAAGPFISGSLFKVGGYWAAWGGAAAFLVVDIALRLVMLERPAKDDAVTSSLTKNTSTPAYTTRTENEEFFTGILCAFIFAMVIGTLESTMAVHVRVAFDWGAFYVGIMLAVIQAPGVLLAVPVGWLKDKRGSRFPTAIGLLSSVPFIVLAGVPGGKGLPAVDNAPWEKPVFVASLAASGLLLALLSGIGSIEAAATVAAVEDREPGVFGPNGGYSRAMAIVNMAWMAGLMCGPLLAEALLPHFGYFVLHCTLGALCFIAGIVATIYLNPAENQSVEQEDA